MLTLSIFIHFQHINGLSKYELGMISQKLDLSSINSLKMFLDFRALTREVVTEIATWKERECYIALQGASTKSSTVLVSNQGYSFGVKRKNDATDTIYWRCNKRPKKKHVSATVITKNYGQVEEEISVGSGKHSHPLTTGLLQDILVQSQVSMTPVIMEHISN